MESVQLTSLFLRPKRLCGRPSCWAVSRRMNSLYYRPNIHGHEDATHELGEYGEVRTLPAIREAVARSFEKTVHPMIDRLVANIHESRTLAETRDLLLPKLISGEILLRDAEKKVEAVA